MRTFPAALGWRLVRGQGRTGVLRVCLMAVGSALGVSLLLVALSVPHVITDRKSRLAARTPTCATHLDLCLVGYAQSDVWSGIPYTRVLVDRPSGTLPPPGISRLPQTGEVFMSPALKRLAYRVGNQQLLQRLPGRLAGTIQSAGLLQPDELLAYVGLSPQQLRGSAHLSVITGYGRGELAQDSLGNVTITTGTDTETFHATKSTTVKEPNGVITTSGSSFTDPRIAERQQRELLTSVATVVLLMPILIFLAACSRLSARTRDRRLAALRLLGMSPTQTRLTNAVETGVVALLGSGIGISVFEASRAPLSKLHIGRYGWYASAFTPPQIQIWMVLLGLPAMSVLLVTVAVRRTTGTVLTSRSGGVARRLSRWRLTPSAIGVGLLVWILLKHGEMGQDANTAFAAGIVLLIVGMAAGVPLLAQLAARQLARATGSLSAQLGARGVQAEPAGVTRVGTGLILLVFVAGITQATVLSKYEASTSNSTAATPVSALRTDVVVAPSRLPDGSQIPSADWRRTSGVLDVVSITSLAPASSDAHARPWVTAAVVASCADLRLITTATLPTCREGVSYTLSDGRAAPAKSGVLRVSDQETLRDNTDLNSGTLLRPTAAAAVALPVQLTVPPAELSQLKQLLHTSTVLAPTNAGLRRLRLTAPLQYYVVTDGSPMALDALRTTGAKLDPTAVVEPSVIPAAVDPNRSAYEDLIGWGTAVSLLIAFASVAVGTVDRAVSRRKNLAMQSVMGVPPRVVLRAQLITVLLPYLVGLASAASLCFLVQAAFQHVEGSGAATSTAQSVLLVTSVAAAAGALLVALSALPSLGRPLTPDLLRQE